MGNTEPKTDCSPTSLAFRGEQVHLQKSFVRFSSELQSGLGIWVLDLIFPKSKRRGEILWLPFNMLVTPHFRWWNLLKP